MATPGRAMHDHDCDGSDCGAMFSLYKHIDLERVSCLNEESQGSCKRVFKPWNERTDLTGESLQSCEGDEELLLHVPYAVHNVSWGSQTPSIFDYWGFKYDSPSNSTIETRLDAAKDLIVSRGHKLASPSPLYTNRDDLDFGIVQDLQPIQEFSLNHDPTGILEYTVNASRFNGVHSLDIHIPESLGADHTEVFFVGLKGEFYERKREAVQAVYELKPMADSSKVPGASGLGSFVS